VYLVLARWRAGMKNENRILGQRELGAGAGALA